MARSSDLSRFCTRPPPKGPPSASAAHGSPLEAAGPEAGAEHPGKGTFCPAVLETARGIKPALPSPWHPAGSHPDRRQEERETDRVLSRKHKSPGEDQMATRTGGDRQQGRHCQAALLDEEIKLRARPAPEPENQTHLVGEAKYA